MGRALTVSSRLIRSSSRTSVFAITPADDIYAEWPECTPGITPAPCTWVGTGYRQFKLKYVNNACPAHAHLRKIAS